MIEDRSIAAAKDDLAAGADNGGNDRSSFVSRIEKRRRVLS